MNAYEHRLYEYALKNDRYSIGKCSGDLQYIASKVLVVTIGSSAPCIRRDASMLSAVILSGSYVQTATDSYRQTTCCCDD